MAAQHHTSRILRALAAGIVITLIALGYAFFSMKKASATLAAVSANRYHSYLLADELRQSSDDLTRLGRTYVVTGNPEYKREYVAILAIRNGKAPRPQDYHRIYWDFVAAGTPKPRPDTEAIPLQDLMEQAGFTEAEFAKLKEAQAYSDGLLKLEVQAMNAVKGKFANARGQYTVTGPPNFELARSLVHSLEYHKLKAQSMQPLHDLFEMLEQRTRLQVETASHDLAYTQNLFGAVLLLLLAELGLWFYLDRRQLAVQLGGKPAELQYVLNEIAQGNLAVTIPPAAHEDSALGRVRTMNNRLKALVQATRVDAGQVINSVGNLHVFTRIAEDSRSKADDSAGQYHGGSRTVPGRDRPHRERDP